MRGTTWSAGAGVLAGLLLANGAWGQSFEEDEDHVSRWNNYTLQLHALHQAQVTTQKVRKESRTGGYAGRPDFYREHRYYAADGGHLLSVVQREVENPENIHSIAVYRRDDQGRVIRDYSSTYLPDYRNAPTQTLAFQHHYPPGVHAYRAFDASGELLDERCEGEIDGKPVMIMLDIDEIDAARGQRYQEDSGIMTTAAYRHCFEGLPETADALLPPH